MVRIKTIRPEPGQRFAPLAAVSADEGGRALLKKRAEELARHPEEEDLAVREPFIHFRLGRSEEYGVPHGVVDEVISVATIARVPCAPPAIAGVINRRGQMLPVVDLRQFFGLTFGPTFGLAAEPRPSSAVDVIVISAASMTVGVCVDELLGIAEYRVDALSTVLPSQGSLDRSHVLGLFGGRVTILNIEKILADLCA